MEHINSPEAVLIMADLDTDLVQELSRFWLTVISMENNQYKLELYRLQDGLE